MWSSRFVGAVIVAAGIVATRTFAAVPPGVTYGRLPLRFERNDGQTDARVAFVSRGAGYTLFLAPDEAVLTLRAPRKQTSNALRPKLLGANPNPFHGGLGV